MNYPSIRPRTMARKKKAVSLPTRVLTAEQLARKFGISKKRMKELLALAELAER